jgi:hypothetical protein
MYLQFPFRENILKNGKFTFIKGFNYFLFKTSFNQIKFRRQKTFLTFNQTFNFDENETFKRYVEWIIN